MESEAVIVGASQLVSKATNRPRCSGGQLHRPREAFPSRLPQSNIFTTLRKEATTELIISIFSLHSPLRNLRVGITLTNFLNYSVQVAIISSFKERQKFSYFRKYVM